MTPSVEAIVFVIDALTEAGQPYLVTGSLATSVYCPPRSTLDADFVVEMNSEQLAQLFVRLSQRFLHDSQMAFETVTGKNQHRFRDPRTSFVIEIFEAKMNDPHECARFERRLCGKVEGRDAYVPTAEDIIVQKLRWYKQIHRAKDAGDIRSVLLHQWYDLDWEYVKRWCGEHTTRDLFDRFREEVRPLLERE